MSAPAGPVISQRCLTADADNKQYGYVYEHTRCLHTKPLTVLEKSPDDDDITGLSLLVEHLFNGPNDPNNANDYRTRYSNSGSVPSPILETADSTQCEAENRQLTYFNAGVEGQYGK